MLSFDLQLCSLLKASTMVCSLSLDFFIFCFPSWCFLDETCTFRTLFFVDRICLQALQNSFPSLTMKFSSGNYRPRSCNGTVLLFPRRLHLPEVDCSDRSLAIDDGTGLSSVSRKSVADAILAEQEKELPLGWAAQVRHNFCELRENCNFSSLKTL